MYIIQKTTKESIWIVLIIINLGTSGQYCSKITDLFNTPIADQCLPCADSKQRVDNEYGGIYSFSCKTASRLTSSIGFRRRGEPQLTDPKINLEPAAIKHRYGYAVHEVPEELFLSENANSKLL